jgi:hypothetical protein
VAAGEAAARPAAGTVERRIYASAPPEVVWRILHSGVADPAQYALLVLEPPPPGWPAAGSQRSGRLRLGPVRTRVSAESLEARPSRRFRIAITGASVDGEARWELVGASGGTRIACALRLAGITRVGRLLVWLERGALGRRLETELAVLKLASESDAPSGVAGAS